MFFDLVSVPAPAVVESALACLYGFCEGSPSTFDVERFPLDLVLSFFESDESAVKSESIQILRLFARTHQHFFLSKQLLDFMLQIGKSDCNYQLRFQAFWAVGELIGCADLALIAEFVGETELGPGTLEFIMTCISFIIENVENDATLAFLGLWTIRQLRWRFLTSRLGGYDRVIDSEEIQEFFVQCEEMDNEEINQFLATMDDQMQEHADILLGGIEKCDDLLRQYTGPQVLFQFTKKTD
jgi:hypothetical protein